MATTGTVSQEMADDLMTRFGKGFFRADPDLLRACVTDDFCWHLHEGPEVPRGRTVRGVDAVVEVIRWRREHWLDVRYDDVHVTTDGTQIVQTFRVSGIDEHGHRFDCRAVDLYPVRDGLVAAKDSYWKLIPRES